MNNPKLRCVAYEPLRSAIALQGADNEVGLTHASTDIEPVNRMSFTGRVEIVPCQLTGVAGTVAGYALVIADVPANNADPPVPGIGEFVVPLNVTFVEPTVPVRPFPLASVIDVAPAALFKRHHRTGESAATAAP
jgi:hypothetical protein